MKALNGIKVIEQGQIIAGPFAGKTLAEFGADVTKIKAEGTGAPLLRGPNDALKPRDPPLNRCCAARPQSR
ncbi:CoA transferase [Rhodocyclaceae bacterium SMB388]